MRRILYLSLLTVTYSFSYGQIQAIKDTAFEIEGKMSNSFYEQSNDQQSELGSILNLDVFKHFKLEETYDTDLKRKNFKNTSDYKEKLNELTVLRKDLCAKPYYLDFEPSYYEKNNTFKYDLVTKSFALTNEIYKDEMYTGTNIIQFDNIILSLVNGVTISRKEYESGDVAYVRQRINFKVSDEQTASLLENSRSSIKVLFVFKFVSQLNFLGRFFGSSVTVPGISGKLSSVIMYDSDNNKVIKTFKQKSND